MTKYRIIEKDEKFIVQRRGSKLIMMDITYYWTNAYTANTYDDAKQYLEKLKKLAEGPKVLFEDEF